MHVSISARVVRAALVCALVAGSWGGSARASIYTAAVGADWHLTDLQVDGGAASSLIALGSISATTESRTHGNARADFWANAPDTRLIAVGDSLLLSPSAWGDAALPSMSVAQSSSIVTGTMYFMNIGTTALNVTVSFSLIPELTNLVEASASVDDVLIEQSWAEAGIRFEDALDQETTLFHVTADGVLGPPSDSDGQVPYLWQTTLTVEPGSTADVKVITEARGEAFVNPEPGAVIIWSVLGLSGLGLTWVRRRAGQRD